MKIEITYFLGTVLCIVIGVSFFLELLGERKKTIAKKNIHLRREKCEVCASVCFVVLSLKFWRCQFCGSLNK
jgi:hypothetical protein